jgi:hypothetical protein
MNATVINWRREFEQRSWPTVERLANLLVRRFLQITVNIKVTLYFFGGSVILQVYNALFDREKNGSFVGSGRFAAFLLNPAQEFLFQPLHTLSSLLHTFAEWQCRKRGLHGLVGRLCVTG